jgi:hypothetical protein
MYQCSATLTTVTIWLSDETWSQLDPRAGRLRGRSRIALTVSLIAAAVLVLAGIAAGRSGLLSPRISAHWQEIHTLPGSHAITETLLLSTDGTFDERLTGVAAGGPGLRVTATTPLPALIPQSRSLPFTVRITITDCAVVANTGVRIVLRVHRFWGTASHPINEDGADGRPRIPADVLKGICG